MKIIHNYNTRRNVKIIKAIKTIQRSMRGRIARKKISILRKKAKISSNGFDETLNCFGINAGLTREEWNKKGWIFPEDPLGWFQWYCRYTIGRRLPEIDEIQISRWCAFGPRHIGGIKKNCEKGDLNCRKRQRQALLQWGYNPFF